MLMDLLGKVWKFLPRTVRQRISRSVQFKFTVSAAGIITNEKGEVLLLDHYLRPDSGWGVPGGFMEKGEQPEAAFRREIREETGIEVRDVEIHRVRTLGRHIEVIYTAHASGEAQAISREIRESRWFAPEDVPKEMSRDQQFLVQKALSGTVQDQAD